MLPKDKGRKTADGGANNQRFFGRDDQQATRLELKPAAPEHQTTFDVCLDANDREPERWDGLS